MNYGTPEYTEYMAEFPHRILEEDVVLHVIHGLWNQGVQAIAPANDPRDKPMCKYRTPEGHRCAGGWCIPDSIYEESMEGHVIPILVDNPRWKDKLPSYFHKYRDILMKLQNLHDAHSTWESREVLKGRLQGFAFATAGYLITLN